MLETATSTLATTTMPGTQQAGAAPAAGAALPPIDLGTGVNVSGETIWGSMTPAGWGLSFSVQPSWQVSTIKDASGNPSYVSISGPDSAIIVTKELAIAAPATANHSATMQTIAGQHVYVTKYYDPQKGFPYSLSFAVIAKGSTYHFYYQSATTSTQTSDDFISLIHL
jgi:hypothetical protein